MTSPHPAPGRPGAAPRTARFDDTAWHWSGPAPAAVRRGTTLEIAVRRGTDLYAMPGCYEADALPLLQRPVHGDFTAWTRIGVEGHAFGDAGGIALHGADGWLKVCVERTRDGGWAIVTVLTRPVSDEARGPSLSGPAADLQITRQGTRYAVFHRERPHEDWQFVRTFLGFPEPEVRLGLFAQAPFGESCTATFTAPRMSSVAAADRR